MRPLGGSFHPPILEYGCSVTQTTKKLSLDQESNFCTRHGYSYLFGTEMAQTQPPTPHPLDLNPIFCAEVFYMLFLTT